MNDDVVQKWQRALAKLGMTDAEQEQQVSLIGELISLRLLEELSLNPGLTSDEVKTALESLDEESRSQVLEKVTKEALETYFSKIEEVYSPEQRATFEQAVLSTY